MNFFIKKLGCPKNDVDGDYIAALLIEAGHNPVDDDTEADLVIVNTCGFILPAKEESIEEILYYEDLKKKGTIKKLFVTGCLSQRYGAEALREIEGIDAVFGLGNHEDILKAIEAGDGFKTDFKFGKNSGQSYISGVKRYFNPGYPYEYLKISDGCDRFCAYCAIPFIRGRYRSRPMDDIIREAKEAVCCGKKELILVSQEGTAYGRDMQNGTDVMKLLAGLEQIDGIEWIRLMYLHPESVTDSLIEYMTSSGKVLSYFDIPLQHINDGLLRKMNRRVTRVQIEDIIDKIRNTDPEATIRTSFIAGLPGETEKEFTELEEFIKTVEFDRMGVFAYSPEEDTSAASMENQNETEVIGERQDRLMAVQQEIAFNKNINLIGSIQQVIIDRVDTGSQSEGRTKSDCPDIDQMVYVRGSDLKVGDIIDVRVTMAEGYDLIAETERL